MKKIVLIIGFLVSAIQGFGQDFDPEVAMQRVKDKVEDYQNQLEILADGANKQSTRNTARDAAKDLFISRGGNYTYEINYQTVYDKCTMETMNKNRPRNKYQKLVKTYLDIMAQRPYHVKVSPTKEVVVDKLKKIGPNQWMVTAHIGQLYQQNGIDGRRGYQDVTFKDIVAFVHVFSNPVDGRISYEIFLEDCLATGVTDVPPELQ